jgi:hypothetical protein
MASSAVMLKEWFATPGRSADRRQTHDTAVLFASECPLDGALSSDRLKG